jgi:hypothetical protein
MMKDIELLMPEAERLCREAKAQSGMEVHPEVLFPSANLRALRRRPANDR